MRIRTVSVKNLFGMFNHSIPLRLEDRITIIHGPNGFGKTVLLRMVDGLFKGNFAIFQLIPFDRFLVEFENGKTVTVKRTHRKKRGEGAKIAVSSSDPNEEPFSPETIGPQDLEFPLSMIDDIVPNLSMVGQQSWRDLKTGQVLSFPEVVEKYGDFLPGRPKYRQIPKWFRDAQLEIKTHFVQTNRLIRQAPANVTRARVPRGWEQNIEPQPTAVQYSKELADKIQQVLARSAELSQSLDRSFPARLVSQLGEKRRRSLTDLKERLRKLEEKRKRLMAAGLMEQAKEDVQISEEAEVAELTRAVLSIYIKDVGKKLRVFDEILKKIELLQKIVNDRFLYKNMTINKIDGFMFETPEGTPLAPDSLSSGEQHELVLFYELLFRIQGGSLILIDEPELSLHIEWQQQFLKDLRAITKLAHFDVVVATHSPDIIFDRWDLTVELKGPDA